MTGKAWQLEPKAAGHSILRKLEEANADVQRSLDVSSGTPTCRSKLGRAFSPQLTQSRKSLTDALRSLFPR